MRTIVVIVALAALGAVGAWVMAGRAEGPGIEIAEPDVVGQTGRLALEIGTPRGALTRLDVHIEQDGGVLPLFTLAEDAGELIRVEEDRLALRGPLGRRSVPELRAGPATLVVTAARPVLFGYREAETTARHELEVRLTPPQLAVVSSFHYINHGGSEMVV